MNTHKLKKKKAYLITKKTKHVNTHKTMVYIDWLMKARPTQPAPWRNRTLYLLLGATVQCQLIQYCGNFKKHTYIANNEW